MNSSYVLVQEAAAEQLQLYTLMRYASKCSHVSAFTLNKYDALIAFLASQPSEIQIYNLGPVDFPTVEEYIKIAKELELDLSIGPITRQVQTTDLLYIDTPAEGNYRRSELDKFSKLVKKYILLPNTNRYGLSPAADIQLENNIQPVGLNFGINHFIQNNDNWFILEHDDSAAGMTVLVNRDNV